MQTSTKDSILIAVLTNVGLLAVLFVTAIQHSEVETPTESVVAEVPKPAPQAVHLVAINEQPRDEVDQALKAYHEHVEEPPAVSEDDEFVNITVKPGDALEKIARANHTSVGELRRINNLNTDRLRIGQLVKVPLQAHEPVATTKAEQGDYYTIQAGDNPWTIAKKFHVRYDDILKLNDLDESRARRLRAGDKIRIR